MAKMTNAERFQLIKETFFEIDIDPEIKDDICAFCDSQIITLAKKSEKSRERAAAKAAEKGPDTLYDAIVPMLTLEPQIAEDILAKITDPDVSIAKVRARLTKAVKNGVANKIEVLVGEKKRSAYTKA